MQKYQVGVIYLQNVHINTHRKASESLVVNASFDFLYRSLPYI